MKSTFAGYAAALCATIIWAGNFVVARAFAEAMPPCQFNFWRWVIAFVAIAPFAVPRWRTEWPEVIRNLGYLSLMGLIGVTLMNAFIYKAGQSTESLNMALVMPATPVVILILARLVYGEKIPFLRLSGVSLAIAGILLLISRGEWHRLAGLDFTAGDLWSLGCMLSFAIYSLLLRQRPHTLSPAVFNTAVFGLGLVFALPMVAAELWFLPAPSFSWSLAGALLYAGLGCSTVCFWLWTIGIDNLGPVRTSMVYYSLPIFAAIMSVICLNESVSGVQIAGGIMITCGVLLASLR